MDASIDRLGRRASDRERVELPLLEPALLFEMRDRPTRLELLQAPYPHARLARPLSRGLELRDEVVTGRLRLGAVEAAARQTGRMSSDPPSVHAPLHDATESLFALLDPDRDLPGPRVPAPPLGLEPEHPGSLALELESPDAKHALQPELEAPHDPPPCSTPRSRSKPSSRRVTSPRGCAR